MILGQKAIDRNLIFCPGFYCRNLFAAPEQSFYQRGYCFFPCSAKKQKIKGGESN